MSYIYDPIAAFTHLHGTPPPGMPGRMTYAERERAEREANEREQAEEELSQPQDLPADPPPPGEVAAAPAADEGGSPPGAALAESPHPPAEPGEASDSPRPPPGEDREAETLRVMRAWLNQHWDAVEAMARAGEAPQRPAPAPEVKPETGAAGGEPPPPPPYVEPEDRWTKRKMAQFLRHLAATHSVTKAAKAVGMGRQSAYKLRTRLKGQPFDVAWETAFRHGYDNLAHSALELALEGEEVPHYYKGELVGTHKKRHPQMIVQLLNMRNRAGAPMLGRYGAAAEFWSEDWDRMTQRVETGSVTWSDEQNALGAEERAALALPDARQEADRIIERNRPDDPANGRSRG